MTVVQYIMMFCCAFALAFSNVASAQQDTSDKNSEKEYQEKIKAQFKNESVWYRLFHGYEINPGFSKYSIGPSYTFPMLGYKGQQDQFGLRYRSTHFEMGGAYWRAPLSESGKIENHKRISLGYFTPLNIFSIGKRYLDVKGFLIQPTASLGYTNTDGHHGVYTAAGLHVQLPFGVVAARANLEYTLGGGFNVFPEVSVQLDALRTLLDPQTVKTGVYHRSSTLVEPLGGGWVRVTDTSSSSNFHIKDVQPFWGIVPRVGWGNKRWVHTPYLTKGLGLSGRLNAFGLDLYATRGKLTTGVVPNVQALDATVRNSFENKHVEGLVNTTELTAQLNVNIAFLVLNVFKRNAIKDMGNTATPLRRFNFNIGYTYFGVGKVNYTNQTNAEAYTRQFFLENPEVEQNAINDPMQHENGWGVTYGVTYEMGVVGFGVNNKISHTAGRSTTFDFYYIIPISKVMKAYFD